MSHTHAQWKVEKDTIDSLHLNHAVTILYLSHLPHLLAEEHSDGPYPYLNLVFDILTRNAQNYITQLPTLTPSLAVYLAILLNFIIKYTSQYSIPLQNHLKLLIQ